MIVDLLDERTERHCCYFAAKDSPTMTHTPDAKGLPRASIARFLLSSRDVYAYVCIRSYICIHVSRIRVIARCGRNSQRRMKKRRSETVLFVYTVHTTCARARTRYTYYCVYIVYCVVGATTMIIMIIIMIIITTMIVTSNNNEIKEADLSSKCET